MSTNVDIAILQLDESPVARMRSRAGSLKKQPCHNSFKSNRTKISMAYSQTSDQVVNTDGYWNPTLFKISTLHAMQDIVDETPENKQEDSLRISDDPANDYLGQPINLRVKKCQTRR